MAVLDGTVGHVAGVVLFAFGLATTLWAQIVMGDSWRVGVDPVERTDLVTDGPFGLVRNPIFAGMLPTSLGLALLVPNVVGLIGLASLGPLRPGPRTARASVAFLHRRCADRYG